MLAESIKNTYSKLEGPEILNLGKSIFNIATTVREKNVISVGSIGAGASPATAYAIDGLLQYWDNEYDLKNLMLKYEFKIDSSGVDLCENSSGVNPHMSFTQHGIVSGKISIGSEGIPIVDLVIAEVNKQSDVQSDTLCYLNGYSPEVAVLMISDAKAGEELQKTLAQKYSFASVKIDLSAMGVPATRLEQYSVAVRKAAGGWSVNFQMLLGRLLPLTKMGVDRFMEDCYEPRCEATEPDKKRQRSETWKSDHMFAFKASNMQWGPTSMPKDQLEYCVQNSLDERQTELLYFLEQQFPTPQFPAKVDPQLPQPLEQEEFFNLTKSITTISTDAKADGSRSNPWGFVVPMDTSKGNATTPMIWARNQSRLVFATELLRLLGIDMQGDERALEDHSEKFLLSLTPTIFNAFGLALVLTATFVSAPTKHLRAVDEPEETQASSTDSPF